MATTLSAVFILLILTILGVNILIGHKIGLRRALFRLAFILFSALLAFLLRETPVSLIFDAFDLGGLIDSFLPASLAYLADLTVGMVRCGIVILSFVTFYIFFSLVGSILALCMRNVFKQEPQGVFGEESRWESKAVGAVVAGVAGLAVCLFLLAPVNGVLYMGGAVCETVEPVVAVADGDGTAQDALGVMRDIAEYKNSAVCQDVYEVTKWFVCGLADFVLDAEGVTANLGAVIGVVEELGDLVGTLAQIDFSNLQNMGADEITRLFVQLQSARDAMGAESTRFVTSLVRQAVTAVGGTGLEVNLDNIDFGKVDFAEEGKIITDYVESAEKKPADYAEALLESDLVVYVLYGLDKSLTVSDDEKTQVTEAVERSTVAIDKKQMVEKIYGLSRN